MNQILLAFGILICGALASVISVNLHGDAKIFKTTMGKKDLIFRALSLLLFFLYIPYLFSLEVASGQVGLSGGVLSPIAPFFTAILKWQYSQSGSA